MGFYLSILREPKSWLGVHTARGIVGFIINYSAAQRSRAVLNTTSNCFVVRVGNLKFSDSVRSSFKKKLEARVNTLFVAERQRRCYARTNC